MYASPVVPAPAHARSHARPAPPAHLHALDALRGVAALAVVFWHWQHFFLGRGGRHLADFAFAREPLFAVFGALYTDGWRAVELFFCLSGFIFAWLYADLIRSGDVAPRTFAVLRLSRLYPLHLATLLFVAAGQAWMVRAAGMPFVYQCNDAYHFALHLVFAGNWGLERCDSFNGPTWSVSVEILLYALFFVACRLGVRRWWQFAAVSAAGYALMVAAEPVSNGVSRDGIGVFCFFGGCVAFLAYRALWSLRLPARVYGAGLALAAGAWLAVPLNEREWFYYLWLNKVARRVLADPGHDLVSRGLWFLSKHHRYAHEFVVFPLTIVALALWESARGGVGQGSRVFGAVRALGDLSYSSYLVHFPLQLVLVGATVALGVSRDVFYSPVALAGFFAVLIPLSLVTYRGFELPAQRWLRARLLGGARPVRRPAVAVGEEERAPLAA